MNLFLNKYITGRFEKNLSLKTKKYTSYKSKVRGPMIFFLCNALITPLTYFYVVQSEVLRSQSKWLNFYLLVDMIINKTLSSAPCRYNTQLIPKLTLILLNWVCLLCFSFIWKTYTDDTKSQSFTVIKLFFTCIYNNTAKSISI